MTFVTFVIAMAAIGAFYLYSTKPACREAVNNWSISACDALQEKISPSSGKIVKRKVTIGNTIQPFFRSTEVPVEAQQAGSTVSSNSTGSRQVTETPHDDKPPVVQEGEIHAGTITPRPSTLNQEQVQPPSLRAGAIPISSTPEKGLVTGEKKKKKKKSKSKKSKKKKSSKGNKKEGENEGEGEKTKKKKKKKSKKSEETLPEEP